ncbi:(R)-stereoselective amidase [Lysinibacillus sphaericus]|uniref:(R)-stereoselective amidase n=2 Tax=Bacillaceae TaxID=186817 RepID=A0A2S5D3A4_LYSSH|nr:carbon-nitrogen hydrolase family protein [Lysinibacillus sphaericus]POZ57467.1 (R)-stereoselective amidase [Lysinibacillus sphaericus]
MLAVIDFIKKWGVIMLKHVVAAIQMNCELGNKEGNLLKAQTLIKQALEQQATLIVLPELFNTGYRVEDQDWQYAETIPGETTSYLQRIATQHDITIIGCILERGEIEGMIFDTAFVIAKNGILGKYRKTHLWDQENLRFTRGDTLSVIQKGDLKMGLQICYEIGFPEGARLLTLQGANLLIYPSAFSEKRYYVWDTASKARAIENGCFVIAANRSGIEKQSTNFGGKSRIIDPQGNVLIEATKEDECIVATIDIQQVIQQRREVPYLRDLNKVLFYPSL